MVKVNYTPPPQDLSKLNPLQRYMQKGSLDYQDWFRLILLVLAYWFLRPYLQKLFKKWSGSEEGEAEQEAYQKRRLKAKISPSNIRGEKDNSGAQTIGQLLDDGAIASGSKMEEQEGKQEVKSRKKGVSFAPEKSEEDKLLDWDDEPIAGNVKAEKNDIVEWLDKWTKENI